MPFRCLDSRTNVRTRRLLIMLNPVISFQASPDQYRHWKLQIAGAVATLSMDVQEDETLAEGYKLKLNSYDLGVDIELADAVQRIRFEHPEVRVVVITSLKPRIFCAGANIYMLGSSSHAFKVNFCKFTNETRCAIEDDSKHSGRRYVAALNGTASGGGYELAIACDEIYLVDDGNSAVSLPEVPLLGVLPGTGGLTRLVDKRKVRRDRADVFSTLAEGLKSKGAAEWGLIDGHFPTSKFQEGVEARVAEILKGAEGRGAGPGIRLNPLDVEASEGGRAADDGGRDSEARRRVLAAARVPRAGRRAASPEDERAGGRARAAARRGRDRRRVGGRQGSGREPRALARPRDHPVHGAGAAPARPDGQELLRAGRAGGLLRRQPARTPARLRPQLHAQRPRPEGRAGRERAERGRAPDVERADAAAVALPRGARAGRRRPRTRGAPRHGGGRGGGPRHLRPRRPRLGGRNPRRRRGTHLALPRRADRHGGQPQIRRPRDARHQDLRPAHGLAELDFPAPQRRRPAGGAHELRQADAAAVRLQADLRNSG